MNKQNKILLFQEHYKNIKDLTLEQKGKILDNIFCRDYVWTDNESVVMATKYILSQVERSDEAYSKVCTKNKETAIKREAEKKHERVHLCTNVHEEHLPNPNPNPNPKNKEYKKECVEVMNHFNSVCKKSLALDDNRIKIISKRLKDGKTVEQLCQAIINFSKDTWDERKSHCDIIYAIGIRNKVDNFDRWYGDKAKQSPLDLLRAKRG